MPEFHIELSEIAREQITKFVGDPSKKAVAKAVIKSLGFMRTNIKHPSLNTHKYDAIKSPERIRASDLVILIEIPAL